MFLSVKWLLISFAISTLMSIGSYKIGYHLGMVEGRAALAVELAEAQAEHGKQVKKRYDKIDKETPFNSNKSVAIEWMRNFTTRQ